MIYFLRLCSRCVGSRMLLLMIRVRVGLSKLFRQFGLELPSIPSSQSSLNKSTAQISVTAESVVDSAEQFEF